MTGQPDIHAMYCCQIHGCKYDDDDCPVARGYIIGGKYCEACAEEQMMKDDPSKHYWAPKLNYKDIEHDEVDNNLDDEALVLWNELQKECCYIALFTMHQGMRCCKIEAGIPYRAMSFTENKLAFGLTFKEALQEVKEWSKKIINQPVPRI